MTSIEDAWGVSDISTTPDIPNPNRFLSTPTQEKHLHAHVIPKSSVLPNHPNSIQESTPTRMEIAVYHPAVIQHLMTKPVNVRTAIVTDLVRASMQPTFHPPEAPATVDTTTEPKKEYFEAFHHSDNMTMLVLITLILLLVDKLFTIWKNS